jgi:hypothetical protein
MNIQETVVSTKRDSRRPRLDQDLDRLRRLLSKSMDGRLLIAISKCTP